MSYLHRARPAVVATAAAVLSVALAAPAVAAPTSSADDTTLVVVYHVKGASHLAASGATLPVKPTTITTDLQQDLSFTGSLPIRPAKVSAVLNGIATTVVVRFTAVGPATGQLTSDGGAFTVSALAHYVVSLSNLTLNGTRVKIGPNCQTTDPVDIPVATPPGQTFDLTAGGTITGTYTIGSFQNCGDYTPVFNQAVSGPGNTLSLTLRDGQALDPA